MTNCVSFCSRMPSEDMYGIQYGDDDDEDDDYDDDDDDDGLDGFSDLDDDMPPCRNIGRHVSNANFELRNGIGNGDFRHQSNACEGSSSLIDANDDNRRDHHNQLERKRRASIKGSYNDLRESIPSLRGSKASRASILQRAVEYIRELIEERQVHMRQCETIGQRNEMVESQVHNLQLQLQQLNEDPLYEEPVTTVTDSSTSNSVALRVSSCSNPIGGVATISNVPVNTSVPSSFTRSVSSDVCPVLDRITPIHGPITTKSQTLTYFAAQSQANQWTIARPIPNGRLHSIVSSHRASPVLRPRTRTSPTLHVISAPVSNNGLTALTTAVSLISGSTSAFSSTSSTEPTQSSSQRSSPGGLSSSSSNASSSVQSGTCKREAGEESSLVIDLPSQLDEDSNELPMPVTGSIRCITGANKNIRTSSSFRPISPPVLLSASTRSSTSMGVSDSVVRVKQPVSRPFSMTSNDLSKRQRLS